MNALKHGLRVTFPAWLQFLVAAIALSVVMLWPLPARLSEVTLDIGDALHQAWSIRWIQYALSTPGVGLFAAPTNYPFDRSLTLNQPIYTSALLGMPLYWLGWSPSAVFNALVIGSFTLSCWAMALLGRQLTSSSVAGLVAGTLYAFAQVRFAHLVHLNLLSGFWTVLTLVVVVRVWFTPSSRGKAFIGYAILLGSLIGAQALADVYNGIYLVVALALALVWRCVTASWKVALQNTLLLGAGGLLAIGICLPVLLPTVQTWQTLQLQRSDADHEHFSAHPKHYLVRVGSSLLRYDTRSYYEDAPQADAVEQTLWPGFLTLALAGASLPTLRRDARGVAGYFALLGLAAFVLSLGPTIAFDDQRTGIPSPMYRWLYEHAPFFSAARVPARWAFLVQLAISALAAYGVASLLDSLRRLLTQEQRMIRLVRPATLLLSLILVALSITDSWRGPVRATTNIVGESLPEVYHALAQLPPGPVLEWPLMNADPLLVHRYEYYTLAHRNPIVNSASSIVPQQHTDLLNALYPFPDAQAVDVLREIGVRYVNVNRWELSGWGAFAARLDTTVGLRRVAEYESGRHVLFEITSPYTFTSANAMDVQSPYVSPLIPDP